MIDRHRDQISGTVKRTSERRISAPSREKFSGGITPSQAVPATLQHYAQGSTIIAPSTLLEDVMRKPRDFDGELKALQDKARDLKSRKVQQLGELVCESARGPDADRHVKLLIQFAVGGHFRALVHTLPRPLAVRSTIFARQTCF